MHNLSILLLMSVPVEIWSGWGYSRCIFIWYLWFYHPDLLCLWLMLIVLLSSGVGSRSHVRMGPIFPFCATHLPYIIEPLCQWYLSWVLSSINHFCLFLTITNILSVTDYYRSGYICMYVYMWVSCLYICVHISICILYICWLLTVLLERHDTWLPPQWNKDGGVGAV